MRARERERVECHAARALHLVAPDLVLVVGWTRSPMWRGLVVAHGEAFIFGDRSAVIVLDERLFEESTPDEREDTVRHELAHLVAWHWSGHEIADHGPEFHRARRAIDEALREDE